MWLPSLAGASEKGSKREFEDSSQYSRLGDLRSCTGKEKLQESACLRRSEDEADATPDKGDNERQRQNTGVAREEDDSSGCGEKEEALWPLEVSLQGLAEARVHQWLSLVRSLSFSSTSNLADSPSTSSAGIPEVCPQEKGFPLPKAESHKRFDAGKATAALSGVAQALRRPARWNPLFNAAPVIWPVLTFAIFLAPQAACVVAALLFPGILRPALAVWLAVEAVFLAYRAAEWIHASRNTVAHRVPSTEEVSQLLDHMLSLSNMGVIEPHEFISGWFLGTPLASITLEDLKEFLAFGLYHRDLHELPEDTQAAVAENAERMVARWGLQLCPEPSSDSPGAVPTPGQRPWDRRIGVSLGPVTVGCSSMGWFMSGGCKFMRHTREPLRALLHPLASYVWGHIVGMLTSLVLLALGFQRQRCASSGIGFYILRRSGAAPEKQEESLRAPEAHGQSGGRDASLFERGSLDSDSDAEALETVSFCRKSSSGTLTDSDEGELMDSELWGGSSTGTSSTRAAGGGGSTSSATDSRSDSRAATSNMAAATSASFTPRSTSSDTGNGSGDACVFVHGLGFGVTPYLGFIHQIVRASRHKTVAVVELPHLAFQLCSSVPTVDDILPALDEVVHECVGPQGRATFIGHSYGSLVLAQFVRTRPSRVGSLGLMDPVCILLCLPFVIYNFVYKLVDFDSVRGTISDAARMLLCSLELNVSRALCRGFNWHNLHVWAHHLPRNTVVMLSGEDRIVPSERVRRYLDVHKVPTHYHDSLGHAQFLFSPDAQRSFLDSLFSLQ